MAAGESTCWTALHAAAEGVAGAREGFAARYAPLVRAYLAARWRESPRFGDLDDAVQEVFVECLRAGGGLERAEPGRPGGFRAFLYGLVRNVALRFEQRGGRRREAPLEDDAAVAARESSLSRVFDRAWARAMVEQAAALQASRAEGAGAEARRRVALLRLRFHDALPIREIARRWGVEAAELHRQYAKARAEFKGCLIDVLQAEGHADRAEAERACRELLGLL